MGFEALDLANAARPVRRNVCAKTAIAKEVVEEIEMTGENGIGTRDKSQG
jgi:hypothetical protein